MTVHFNTPLWPAGHLPLKGGDKQFRPYRETAAVGDWRKSLCKLISPLEGEMAGRPEGGAVDKFFAVGESTP